MKVDSERDKTIDEQQAEVLKYVLVIENTVKRIEVLEQLLKEQRANYSHYNTILRLEQYKLDEMKKAQGFR